MPSSPNASSAKKALDAGMYSIFRGEWGEGTSIVVYYPFPKIDCGRPTRTCPGRQFGEAALFITIASVIACFDIAPKPTPTGETPKLTFHDGFIRQVFRTILKIKWRIMVYVCSQAAHNLPYILYSSL